MLRSFDLFCYPADINGPVDCNVLSTSLLAFACRSGKDFVVALMTMLDGIPFVLRGSIQMVRARVSRY